MTRERNELTGQDESAVSEAARKGSSARTIHLASGSDKSPDETVQVIDLHDDALQNEDARFLRREKRVPVRRGPMARKTASRVKTTVAIALTVAVGGGLAAAAYGYGVHANRFIIASSDNIEITGVENVSRPQVMEVAGADIGRNVFFVPLDERRTQLEKLPWVQSATVMRLFPDRIAVQLVERTPVAFVQIGAKVHLIAADGVVLGPPANRQARYSFPVIHGIAEMESLSDRAAVMKTYSRLVHELASGGYTEQLSEVDLSDPDDLKATVNDTGGIVLIHLGSSDFLERYKLFAAHIGEWRQQFAKVQSVDMRYEGQIVVNPDIEKLGDQVIGSSGDRSVPPQADALETPGDPPSTPKASAAGNPAPAPSKGRHRSRQRPGKKTKRPKTKSQKQAPRS